MKGHMQDGKFHPHTDYKGVRKSRDTTKKTKGVKLDYRSDTELGVERNARIKTGFCEICEKFLSEKEFAYNNKRCFECEHIR